MTENVLRSWRSINITVSPDAAEAVEFAFNELGSLGSEINHLGKSERDTVLVIGYFDAAPDDEIIRCELNEALRIYGRPLESVRNIEHKQIENTDWLAEWKRHWKPTQIGKFSIAPPWEKIDAPGRIVISIEPNMAFGTGTHETTQLCLTAIEENYKPGQSFLDVGTGTGILAIAAAKIQFRVPNSKSRDGKFGNPELETQNRIFACDTDADSVAIARENAALNGVGEKIEFYNGSISEKTRRFDFICANLTLDVIVPLLPLLIGKSIGTFVLSGILREQEESIRSELEKFQITDYKIGRAGDWISVVRLSSK